MSSCYFLVSFIGMWYWVSALQVIITMTIDGNSKIQKCDDKCFKWLSHENIAFCFRGFVGFMQATWKYLMGSFKEMHMHSSHGCRYIEPENVVKSGCSISGQKKKFYFRQSMIEKRSEFTNWLHQTHAYMNLSNDSSTDKSLLHSA